MSFDLIVHLKQIADHPKAVKHVVKSWNDCFKIPLQFFSRTGTGQQPDVKFLQDKSQFGRLDDEIWVKLKESRKRSACILEIFYTNPTRAFFGDLNFVAATFPDEWLDLCGSHKATKSIVRFMSAVTEIGDIEDGCFENEDVKYRSPGNEILKAIVSKFDCHIGHIAYLNSKFLAAYGGLAAIRRAGFTIHKKWPHGCIAGIPLNYMPSPREAAWRLFDALESLGVFVRSSRPSLLKKRWLTVKQIGGFLGAYEDRFGKVFAMSTLRGLRPVKDE